MSSQIVTTALRAAPIAIGGAIAAPEIAAVIAVVAVGAGIMMVASRMTNTRFYAKANMDGVEIDVAPV